jgi:pentatricopeptide repeat protein
MPEKALDLFENMAVDANEVVHLILFNACAALSNERAKALGKKQLAQMPRSFLEHVNLVSSAVDMLMKFGDVAEAEDLFKLLKNKTIVSYGALMQGKSERCHRLFAKSLFWSVGYVKNNMSEKALDVFEEVSSSSDDVPYSIGYNACAALSNERARSLGKKYLKQMPPSFHSNQIVTGSALHMLMKFGEVGDAERLFSRMKHPEMAINGVMMNGYNLNDEPDKCLQLFHRIKDEGIGPDEMIPLAAVRACSRIGLRAVSRKVIDFFPTQSLESRRLQNAMIDMWVSGSHRLNRFINKDLYRLWIVPGQSERHQRSENNLSIDL